MEPKYDAIIVGGGHNGLICAAYLAKAGRKVLILEAGPMDRDLDTLWFADKNGRPLGSLTVFGCHPTSLGGYLIGGDDMVCVLSAGGPM